MVKAPFERIPEPFDQEGHDEESQHHHRIKHDDVYLHLVPDKHGEQEKVQPDDEKDDVFVQPKGLQRLVDLYLTECFLVAHEKGQRVVLDHESLRVDEGKHLEFDQLEEDDRYQHRIELDVVGHHLHVVIQKDFLVQCFVAFSAHVLFQVLVPQHFGFVHAYLVAREDEFRGDHQELQEVLQVPQIGSNDCDRDVGRVVPQPQTDHHLSYHVHHFHVSTESYVKDVRVLHHVFRKHDRDDHAAEGPDQPVEFPVKITAKGVRVQQEVPKVSHQDRYDDQQHDVPEKLPIPQPAPGFQVGKPGQEVIFDGRFLRLLLCRRVYLLFRVHGEITARRRRKGRVIRQG